MIESPVVSIHIPAALRRYAEGAEEATVSGDTVAEALSALGHEHPAVLAKLVDEKGALRPYMNLYLGGINVLALEGLDTPLQAEDVLTVISMNIEEMAAEAGSRGEGRVAGETA